MSCSDVVPPDVIETNIIVLLMLVVSAVDETMDVGLRENDDDDDVIDEARGEGAREERRGQRVQQHRHDHNSDAKIEYGYRRSRRRTLYKHRGSSSLTPAQIM